jgi:hypothetical protein
MGLFDAFSGSTSADNNESPFGEAGLLGDPLHYLGGKKYDKFMRKTWELPNEYVGKYLTKFDKFDRKINPIHHAIDRTAIGGKIADYAHNKPGDSALAVLGSVFGGGALLGGAGGGSTGSGLGIFSNGGTAGMGSVGGGNAGALASSGGISGGAGMGTAGTAAGPGELSFGGGNWQQLAQQGMRGQQQPQQKNTAFQDELERQKREQELRKQIADEMGPRYV